jgi:hypothetical protein
MQMQTATCCCAGIRCAASAACTRAAPAAGLPPICKCSCIGLRTVEVSRHSEHCVTTQLTEAPAQVFPRAKGLPVSWLCRHGYVMKLKRRSYVARKLCVAETKDKVTESAGTEA